MTGVGGRSRWVDLDGPTHYRDYGGPADGPVLVCVHGLGGSSLNWAAMAPYLTDTYRILAPDLAGHGRTRSLGRSTDVPANTGLVARFLEQVVGGPAVVAGNSMGGMLALHLAAQRPDLVSGLVLVDPAVPFVVGRPDPLVAAAFASYSIPGVARMSMAARRRAMTPERAAQFLLDLCCVDSSRIPTDVVDAHVAEVRERRDHDTADTDFLAAARSVVRTSALRIAYRDTMRRVQAPVLLLHGTGDRLVPLTAAEAAARLQPEWSFVVLHDVGHAPQLEVPEDTAWVIGDWLQGAGSAARTNASRVLATMRG